MLLIILIIELNFLKITFDLTGCNVSSVFWDEQDFFKLWMTHSLDVSYWTVEKLFSPISWLIVWLSLNPHQLPCPPSSCRHVPLIKSFKSSISQPIAILDLFFCIPSPRHSLHFCNPTALTFDICIPSPVCSLNEPRRDNSLWIYQL